MAPGILDWIVENVHRCTLEVRHSTGATWEACHSQCIACQANYHCISFSCNRSTGQFATLWCISKLLTLYADQAELIGGIYSTTYYLHMLVTPSLSRLKFPLEITRRLSSTILDLTHVDIDYRTYATFLSCSSLTNENPFVPLNGPKHSAGYFCLTYVLPLGSVGAVCAHLQ